MKQSRKHFLWIRQAGQAKDRGIPFQFTFEEWVKWWHDQLGPNWMKLRGRHKNQYHMARFKDKGPYAPWNVECLTNSVNAGDAIRNRRRNGTFTPPPLHLGEKHPNSKLTADEVRSIYRSKLPQKVIADQYGVHWKTVHNIKRRFIWRAETVGLGIPGLARYTKASRVNLHF